MSSVVLKMFTVVANLGQKKFFKRRPQVEQTGKLSKQHVIQHTPHMSNDVQVFTNKLESFALLDKSRLNVFLEEILRFIGRK